jgi:N-formylglutamate amidohydrolase
MDCRVTAPSSLDRVLQIVTPGIQRLPIVLASPHSGRDYPDEFLSATRLDPHTLRKSEDSYVDEIFETGVEHGAPLLKALFPRAYLDTNREAFELDPEMFEDLLPAYVNTRSPRVAAGLGTIARVVAHGQEIYRHKLRFAEALERVERFYRPYHDTLARLVEETRAKFGYCLLIDCHSMPSFGAVSRGASGPAYRRQPFDFVLGDCHGSACSPLVTAAAEGWLTARGYAVSRNTPYAGGFTTRHYGRPGAGVHALQVEINRGLYMNEATMTRKPFLNQLAEQMGELIGMLGTLDLSTSFRPG